MSVACKRIANDQAAALLAAVAVSDPALGQVVRGDLDGDPVSGRDLDEVLAHLARDMGKYLVAVLQLYLVHGSREDLYDEAFNSYCMVFFSHNQRVPSDLVSEQRTPRV